MRSISHDLLKKANTSSGAHLRTGLQRHCPLKNRAVRQNNETAGPLSRGSVCGHVFSEIPVYASSAWGVQAKQRVGQSDDRFEREANRVSRSVMRLPESKIHRRLGTEDQKSEGERIDQASSLARQITPLSSVAEKRGFETQLSAAGNNSRPLPDSERTFFEPLFGFDFSGVRIHSNAAAAQAADRLGANAFTRDRSIFFGAGRYQPESRRGRSLLAHELTHVVQQTTANGTSSNYVQRQGSSRGYCSSVIRNRKGARVKILSVAGRSMLSPAKSNYGVVTSNRVTLSTLPVGNMSYKIRVYHNFEYATGWVPANAITLLRHGIVGNKIYNRGQPGGRVDATQINCLGHASGVKLGVFPGRTSISNTLAGLGYSCVVGDHRKLASAMAAKKKVMMVYLYMYSPSMRPSSDQVLSYRELARKYGWTKSSWKRPYVFFDAKKNPLPIDYHALAYNYSNRQWEWVGNRKDMLFFGYKTAWTFWRAAAINPGKFFNSSRVLVSLACQK